MKNFAPHLLSVAAACAAITCAEATDLAVPRPVAAPGKAPVVEVPRTDPGQYELKNKSSFTASTDSRAPFWPIGWVKSKRGTPQAPQGPRNTLDERSFNVTSILLGEPPLAIVNGRTYGEGEFLRMPKGNAMRIRVQRIGDGMVTLQYEEQMLAVPLRRPELQDKKTDVELLNAEK